MALGHAGVKTVEDLADLSTDELRGAFESKPTGERVRVAGALEGLQIEQAEAEKLILRARVAAGWIEADALDEPAEAYADEDSVAAEEV